MALSWAAMMGIGIGSSVFSSLFSEEEESLAEQSKKLRADQKKVYGEAVSSVRKQFADAITSFDNRLEAYEKQLEATGKYTRSELSKIFSVQNPEIAAYIKNLEKGYKQAETRVYRQVKQANLDEIRRLNQRGGGSILGRVSAGNQLARVEQAETILTQKMAQVLAPQAQVAQMGMTAQQQALAQQSAQQQQLGMAGVMTPAQLQAQAAQTEASLAGQRLAGLPAGYPIQQPGQQPPGMLQQAGQQFIGAGISKLLAPKVT